MASILISTILVSITLNKLTHFTSLGHAVYGVVGVGPIDREGVSTSFSVLGLAVDFNCSSNSSNDGAFLKSSSV